MAARFFCYHAGALAVDPACPWQICTDAGCLVGKVESQERAERAILALLADDLMGLLPCNLATWRCRGLLERRPPAPPEPEREENPFEFDPVQPGDEQ